MTTDRPYRPALSREEALGRIEAGIGTQFHPGVAKAFVALQRGGDPTLALSPAEQAELRRLTEGRRVARGLHAYRRLGAEALLLAGLMGALAAVAVDYVLALPFVVASACALAARLRQRARARRLTASIRATLAQLPSRQPLFHAVVEQIADTAPLAWAGLVSWRESELAGRTELVWPDRESGPPEDSLTSWLIREAEAREDVLAADDVELGREGAHVAVPLRREGVVLGFLVLRFHGGLPRHVELALRASLDDVTPTLTEGGGGRSDVVDRPAVAVH
jgi:hypothetical protein